MEFTEHLFLFVVSEVEGTVGLGDGIFGEAVVPFVVVDEVAMSFEGFEWSYLEHFGCDDG